MTPMPIMVEELLGSQFTYLYVFHCYRLFEFPSLPIQMLKSSAHCDGVEVGSLGSD